MKPYITANNCGIPNHSVAVRTPTIEFETHIWTGPQIHTRTHINI